MPLVCILPNVQVYQYPNGVQVYQYPNGVRACTRCSRGYAEARALGMTLARLVVRKLAQDRLGGRVAAATSLGWPQAWRLLHGNTAVDCA